MCDRSIFPLFWNPAVLPHAGGASPPLTDLVFASSIGPEADEASYFD